MRPRPDPDQTALFDVGDAPVRPVPVQSSSSSAKVSWTKYRPKYPMKCDDCMLVLALARGDAPASRQARWKRKQGSTDRLLCYGHAQERRVNDGLAPLDDSPAQGVRRV